MAYLKRPTSGPACWRDGRGALRCVGGGGLGADLPGAAAPIPAGVSPLQMLVAQVNRFDDPKTPAQFRFIAGTVGGKFSSPPKTKLALDPGNFEDRRLAAVVSAIVLTRDANAFSQGVGEDGFDLIADFLANIQNTITGRPGTESPPIIPPIGTPAGAGGASTDAVGLVNRNLSSSISTVKGFADSLGLPAARVSILGDIPMVAIGAAAIGGVVALFWWTSKRKGRR